MEAKDYKLIAQILLAALLSLPWLKKYGTVGAWIGIAEAVVVWQACALWYRWSNRDKD